MTHGCGVYDLGWVTHIAVRGEDRLRWLSGMVTNAVQQLPEGQGNYSFLLNAQGRIQGDAFVYHDTDHLVLAIDTDQEHKILAHLNHYIIMDDVELEGLCPQFESIGLAGTEAADVLQRLGLSVPELPLDATAMIHHQWLEGSAVTIVRVKMGETPRYEIWAKPAEIPGIWKQLIAGGAQPCGLDAVEALRILEGIPRYGIDLADRDLPQETSQTRALNFNKGCYLGQEIVERIRSRGAVHRSLRQFQLSGPLPSLPADLHAGDTAIGKLTSAVEIPWDGGNAIFAMGIVRTEALTRSDLLTYNGGTAVLLDRPPAFPSPSHISTT